MLVTLVQIDAWDAVAGVAVALRASSVDDPAACHLNGQTWWPAIAKLPTLRYDFFDGSFGGQISAPTSSITIQTEALPALAAPGMADARFRLWTGELGADWSTYTLRFDGRVTGQPQVEDGKAQIDFAVDDRWLDTALLSTYAGTTGAEGPASLKGQVKPLALGAPRYVAGTLIDAVNSVFQVSAYGPVFGFEAALERLLRYGAPIADYANYADLVAATIPRGQWATAKAVGMARFGAPPTGQISFLLQGDAAGTDGWARKPGQLIRRLALLSGGAGKIDDASLNALDAARPYNLSLYLDGQTTARQLIQQIAASVNAVAGVSWTGKLFVRPVGIAAPAITLATDGSSLPAAKPARQIDMGAPWKKLAIGAERAWTVHALADIAFTATLVDMGAYSSATAYREGNIVQSGGATWVYINPASSTGNAPPAPPSSGNSYWNVLAQAGSGGVSPPIITIAASKQAIGFNNAGSITSGDVTVTTERQNTTDAPVFSLTSYDGTAHVIQKSAAYMAATWPSYFSTSGVDNLTVKALYLQGTLPVYGGGMTFVAEAGAGGPSARVALTKVQDGADGSGGAPGLNNAAVTIYQRSAAAPPLPSVAVTYTFATGAIAGLNNGWSATPPAGTNPLYVSVATASAAGGTDTIAAAEWASPVVQAQNGTNGSNGFNSKSLFIYQRAASAPALPSADATFTFSTQALTGLNNGWQATIPGGTNPLWVSTASALSTTDTDTITPGEWAAAAVLAQNGTNGTNGTNGRDAIVFYMDSTPTGMIAGDTWYKPSTKQWQRYDGSGWAPLLGAIASFDALNATYIVAGTIIASKFQLDNGVDLASIVPGQLNTAFTATQGADINLPVTLNAPNTSGPNGDGTQAIVTSPPVSINSDNDAIFVSGSVTVTAPTNRGQIMLQKSTNGGGWVNLIEVSPTTSQLVPNGTYNYSYEDVSHSAGSTLTFRLLAQQFAAQGTGDGSAGTNWTITGGSIRVRRFFSK